MYIQNSINRFAINTYTRLWRYFSSKCALVWCSKQQNTMYTLSLTRNDLRHAILFYTFSESRKRHYFLFYFTLFILLSNMFQKHFLALKSWLASWLTWLALWLAWLAWLAGSHIRQTHVEERSCVTLEKKNFDLIFFRKISSGINFWL